MDNEMTKKFKEVMQNLDKDVIIEAFEAGFEVGFFGNRKSTDDLFIQFTKDKYKYSIIRTSAQKQSFDASRLRGKLF